jgi:alkanesulfonate monooxygenase SsuD/methylene tetrahydromethanopterin reductase-like flavin-dependent oxidoreductase (luciferase family)
MGELRVILPNRIELAVGPGWSPDQVAAMASRLAAL